MVCDLLGSQRESVRSRETGQYIKMKKEGLWNLGERHGSWEGKRINLSVVLFGDLCQRKEIVEEVEVDEE